MKEVRLSWEMKVEDSMECIFPNGLIDKIIDMMKDHQVFLFKGEIGVGKTSLIKEVGKAMGIEGLINSPTYSLVNEYQTENGNTVYHFDLYRLEEDELYNIGFEEYLSDGSITFIEWPEIAHEFYPENPVLIEVKVEGDIRVYNISDQGLLLS